MGSSQIQVYGGKYAELAKQGKLYLAATVAAGVAIPIYTNTAQVFVLWNRSSNKNLVLAELTLAHIGTPSVSANVGFGIVVAGPNLATGNLSAFTESALYPKRVSTMLFQQGTAGRFGTAATIVAIADGNYVPLGISSAGVTAAASTTTPWVNLYKDFDGLWIVPPGIAIVLCGNAAQTAAMAASLSWYEEDIYREAA